MSKKIILSGLHNTGKSTLAQYIAKNFGYVYYPEIARGYIDLLKEGEYKELEKILTIEKTHQLLQFFEDKNDAIIDRCLFDILIYTEYYRQKGLIKDSEHSILNTFLPHNANPFDMSNNPNLKFIIFTKPIKNTSIDILNDYDLWNKILAKYHIENAIYLDNGTIFNDEKGNIDYRKVETFLQEIYGNN